MSQTSLPDKSALFQTYNRLRGQGAEAGRLNRALGLAQSRQAERPYRTTATSCTCPDYLIRGVSCKHILAAKMGDEVQREPEPQTEDVNALLGLS